MSVGQVRSTSLAKVRKYELGYREKKGVGTLEVQINAEV